MKHYSYKISTLIFIRNQAGELLLLKRNKSPNKGCWSPVGGKLDMAYGESPYECAKREVAEETGFDIDIPDLHLFGMIAEKEYEGQGHWLLFLFTCKVPILYLPRDHDEGGFGFFTREAIHTLNVPATDREALWQLFDDYQDSFIAARACCTPGKKLEIRIEESF